MRKKRKRKKRGVATDVKAIYQRGMQLYIEEENYVSALKYLFRAAKAGYKKAYGEIGILFSLFTQRFGEKPYPSFGFRNAVWKIVE